MPSSTAARQRALRERLDVAGLVHDLRRQEQHDLGEVRMDARDELRGDVERRVFVLGEVGHDLADRALDVGRQHGQLIPRDVGRRVPLLRGRLVVEGRDVLRPHAVALQLGVREGRRARFDQRASRREPRRRIRAVGDPAGQPDQPRRRREAVAAVGRLQRQVGPVGEHQRPVHAAFDVEQGPVAVGLRGDQAVTGPRAPRRQLVGQAGVRRRHLQHLAGREVGQVHVDREHQALGQAEIGAVVAGVHHAAASPCSSTAANTSR